MKPLGFTVQQMCDLLSATDDLRHVDATRRTDAERQLAGFAADARQRCDKLRAELERAEEFARRIDQMAPRSMSERAIGTQQSR